jgi:hypothetical protein
MILGLSVGGRGGLNPLVARIRKKQMQNLKQKVQYGVAVAATTLMTAPVWAADEGALDSAALVSGINLAKPIVIAVGTAIFGVIGILVALRYGKKAAN